MASRHLTSAALASLWRRAGCPFEKLACRSRGRRQLGFSYIIERRDWSIGRDGEMIVAHLRRLQPQINCAISTSSRGLHCRVIHFGSIWCFLANIKQTHHSNRIVVTVFHGHEGMGAEMQQAMETLRQYVPRLDVVVTASSLMRGRLQALGVPETKLHLIPIGVDLDLFRPASTEERWQRRRRLGIPDEAICIGSFQKDGVGWGEGLEPKLIKGPDVFVETVTRLSKNYPLFVLLTGPARGYVKRRLEAAGIPYRHDYVSDFGELPSYYHCLDLYLITSREEGGPKALLECMATGVPLVSTRVGMVADVLEDGVNGLVVDVEDVDGLLRGAVRMIEHVDFRRRAVDCGLRTVREYDWSAIVPRYYEQVYAPLLEQRNGR